MKVLLLNPPYPQRIVRRYKCSYNADTFLLPPLELMYLGGVARKSKGQETTLIDAIAEGIGMPEVRRRINAIQPDLIVGITGLECMPNDLAVLGELKADHPKAVVGVFGYLPTTYPKEVMESSKVDVAFVGEPELSFGELIDRIKGGDDISELSGAAVRKNGSFVVNPDRTRNKKLDDLPFPELSLVNSHLYSEPGMGKPFTTMLASRGCPFQCNFCVPMFGHETSFRSPKNVVDEIEVAVRDHGIRFIRFMDDVFNLHRKRVEDICDDIVRRNLKVTWTCLSRVDTLTERLLEKMKAAGCVRLYIGIESGSQKVLDYYKKDLDVKIIPEKMDMVKRLGMEISAFFIVGAPIETREDVEDSIKLAKRINADYVMVDILTAYPGSDLFDRYRDTIRFSLMPYKVENMEDAKQEEYRKWEREFYREFYYRPDYILPRFAKFMRTPVETVKNFVSLSKYVFSAPTGDREHDKYI